LVDVGVKTNNTQHTWFRKDFSGQSSRINYIFCSIPMWAAQFSTTFSIFDHAYLGAVLDPAQLHKQMTMKDFILGSEEYLIRSQDLLHNFSASPTSLTSPPPLPLDLMDSLPPVL
jgi:hypothetical protein